MSTLSSGSDYFPLAILSTVAIIHLNSTSSPDNKLLEGRKIWPEISSRVDHK